jgi:hypothetical protein
MANPFDQFDSGASAKANPFDQFDGGTAVATAQQDIPSLEPQVITPDAGPPQIQAMSPEDMSGGPFGINEPTGDFYQDPGKYLWRQTPEAQQVADGVRSTLSGLVPQSAKGAAEFATPAVGGVEDIGKAYDAVRKYYGGEPIDQVNRQEYPEAYRYENFGQQPLQQKVETVGGDLVNALMGLGIAKGMVGGHGAPEDVKPAEQPPEAPANAPEAPVARSDAEAGSTPQGGTTRLYHGGAGEQAGSDFSPDLKYAQAYADKTPGGQVWYVDVPDGQFKTKDEYGQPITRVVLPDEVANQAKPLQGEPQAVGSTQESPSAARVSVPTADDLRQAVSEGRFDDARDIALQMEKANAAPVDTTPEQTELRPQDEQRPLDERAGQQQANAEQPASVGSEGEQTSGNEGGQPASGEGGTSIKNEATDALREKYGLEPAVQEARKSLGKSWEEAESVSRRDPGVGRRILNDINNGKITAVDDVQVAHLTRETIDAVAERNAAADAVNNAKTPEELDSARSRRELAEEHLQNVVDADRKVGRATAKGLQARQMAAREDYSLTRMESRARAAYGRKLSPKESGRESAYVKGLNAKLKELSDRLDKVQDASDRASGKNVLKEATQARKSGKRIVDYTGEAAAKARERINRQLHGLGAKPAPPTLLADYAIVGADHLARGLTKFADWSAQMVKEFGDKVNPYLKDIWVRAKAIHNAASKAYRTPAEKADSAMQSRLATETVGLKAKMERGDFSKPTREQPAYSKATYRMRQEFNALKGEFDRHVADIERKNATPGQKLVTHTAGLLRAGVLSNPLVVGKLGVAAGIKELSAPLYGATRLGWSKVPGISRIAEASGRNPSLTGLATSELKAKASAITQGIIDAGQSFTKRGSELDRLSGKDKYTRYWYDKVTGSVHAAIKAPVKRAEFTRSLEQRIETSMRQGEDVSHPAVIDRLTNEAAIDANRAILQNANAFSNWVSQLDRTGPAGKILKAVLAPVTRVPSNLVIEFWNHTLGVPHALLRSGIEGVKGIDNISKPTADSIMRQFSQGTVGLSLAAYAWYNHDKIGQLLHSLPKWFQHTPQAMVLDLFSSLGNGDQKEINNMVTYDVPFVKTFTDLSEPLTNSSKPKWQQSQAPWAEYGRKQLASRAIPEVSNYFQKSEHTPGNMVEKALQLNKPVYSKEENKRYFHPASIIEALKERLP